ncbi:hypothetical protein BBP40_004290, partial [Aspergillus hancockii]
MFCPPREEFQIGWICALPIEAAAAKKMLDESFGFLEEQDAADPNIYTLGRIGKHYIVIACLPAGQYSNTAATITANNMICTFSKSLRIGLMVDVGGGIPSTTSDIRLGDIVISCPTGTCGGVLQYDMGKAGVGKFTRTGSLNSPPRSLLAAVSAMRAAELTDDPHYPEYLQSAIGRTRRIQKAFTRPDQYSDRLFQIKYNHPAAADNSVTSDPTSPNTICVLDALDECRPVDQNQLIQRLKDFYNVASLPMQQNWLKFLVTSRPYDDIQTKFKSITDFFPNIYLQEEQENDQIHKEIDLVVKIKVKDLTEASNLPADVEQRVQDQLLQMQHRTYLWLYLAIDDIRTTFQNSLRPATESIILVPPSVNAAYEKILSRVPSGQKDIVKKILRIIVGARRPLTIEEMSMALGVADSPELKTAAAARVDPTRLRNKIRRLCGLFVFINSSKIYLIHQTAREFLIGRSIANRPSSKYTFELQDADSEMSQICIRYLQMDDLECHQEQTESDIQCFLSYSAEHWAEHVRGMSSKQQQEIVDLVNNVYRTTTKMWFPIFWKAVMPYHRDPKMDAVHLAAFNRHSHILKLIITAEKNTINIKDSSGATALTWASQSGHSEVVEMLLEKEADVNTQGGGYGNALQAASSGGHGQIVQMLLEKGADVNAQGGRYRSGLQAASLEGHDQIMQILLEKGADVNAQGGLYGNALQAASSGGHNQIVQMLLKKGADVNAQGGDYGNTLQAASLEEHDQITQVLLGKGADVNAQGGLYGNALQAASLRGHNQIVQMLLEKGAVVRPSGWTPAFEEAQTLFT